MKQLPLIALLLANGVPDFETLVPHAFSRDSEARLKTAQPGDILILPDFPFDTAPVLPVSIDPAPSPQFLLSDRPEYFRTGDGIALQEDVKAGTARLYLYHVPQPGGVSKTVTAVVENPSDAPLRLVLLRSAFPPPSSNYFLVGKTALKEFFESAPNGAPVVIPPHGWAPVDPRLDHLPVSGNALVHGFYEFSLDGPARVSVLQKNPEVDSGEALKRLPRLPPSLPGQRDSGAGRGLFAVCNFEVTQGPAVYDSAQGFAQIVVSDGLVDPWIEGRDGISGAAAQDKGNYGTMYHIRIPYRTTDGRGLALLATSTSAKSPACTPMGAAVRVGSQTVLVPASSSYIDGPPQTVLLARYPPLRRGSKGVIELTYSPPGASCLPMPLLLVPYKP